jgi:hypothetical protein
MGRRDKWEDLRKYICVISYEEWMNTIDIDVAANLVKMKIYQLSSDSNSHWLKIDAVDEYVEQKSQMRKER